MLGGGLEELEPHGVVRSDNRTPFSRASCSRVIGMNDPIEKLLADIQNDISAPSLMLFTLP